MFDIILYEPEIPPNTGNIIRLAANMGAGLHLIQPLAFELDDKKLRRAGLDYREWARVRVHAGLDACLQTLEAVQLFALTTKAARCYSDASFVSGAAFLFGPESRGLPGRVLEAMPESSRLRVPMIAESRSLNLSNTVAVVLYEAWRQNGFAGGV
ncbi:tRNA (cytidine(34)-2'-O)-methyltransferase [Candidatus Methylospira mobilis]|uniref:tRNA (cytidine(34)-2'-O)-methyltransferase n=1 Tax=Candidatus Methylospira mobilis TaxID=1808979 RepID=UPI0028E7ECA9|nr:tRNA (cytidine(34)-2'-O)-methyltransferase [Candidatus Methylospira mobilis]WNV04567.1 tRNA (cytidine(34)-2'-O)-methyltransferase [Candidatus Methylospira mobilis]